jgi:putative transposase
MSYSKDYKKRAVEYKREGHTVSETREAFRMAESTLHQWEKEYDAGFPEKPKRTCEKKINKEALRRAVEECPDSELSELAEPFGCTPQAIFYALKRMGITRKKRRLPIPKNQKRNEQNMKII